MSKHHRGFIEVYRPRAATSALIERMKAVLTEYADYLPLTARIGLAVVFKLGC
jgi:hypothetical protein